MQLNHEKETKKEKHWQRVGLFLDNDPYRIAQDGSPPAIGQSRPKNRQIQRVRCSGPYFVDGDFCTDRSLVGLYLVSSPGLLNKKRPTLPPPPILYSFETRNQLNFLSIL